MGRAEGLNNIMGRVCVATVTLLSASSLEPRDQTSGLVQLQSLDSRCGGQAWCLGQGSGSPGNGWQEVWAQKTCVILGRSLTYLSLSLHIWPMVML